MRTLPIFVVAACATNPPAPTGGPRGLRASEHLDEARMHERVARHPFAGVDENGGPWARHWDTGSEDTEAAAVHRSQAAALRADYARECGDRPLAEASVSPLDRHAIGGSLTGNGAVLYFDASAGPPDRLLGDLRCHRAWMMLAPEEPEHDPLDLPGLVLDARGDVDGITVSLAVRDSALVPELQRRVARLLARPHRG